MFPAMPVRDEAYATALARYDDRTLVRAARLWAEALDFK